MLLLYVIYLLLLGHLFKSDKCNMNSLLKQKVRNESNNDASCNLNNQAPRELNKSFKMINN